MSIYTVKEYALKKNLVPLALPVAVAVLLALSACQTPPAAVSEPAIAESAEPAVDASSAASEAEAASPSVDTISAASGKHYYEAGSYDAEKLKVALSKYPYAGSVTISTVNEDGSPNLAVAIPGLSADGQYLTFGLAENRTRLNMVGRRFAVVAIYEYAPTAENKADRNRGCRIIVEYPGEETNAALNAGKERPSLYMKIVKILPLG